MPDRPAYLIAYDGHTGWANTKALKLAGITRHTKSAGQRHDREGSAHRRAERRAQGSGDGVDERRPHRSRPRTIASRRFAPAIDEAHRLGITSVQNAGGTVEDLELFDGLRKRGELTLRVYQALRADAALDRG